MDPQIWREEAKLTLRHMAERLGRGISSIRRYEIGEKEAPNSVVIGYERVSNRQVTGADFARVRRRWLREHPEDASKAA